MTTPGPAQKILIINGHQQWPIAPGRLNRSLVEFAHARLTQRGHHVDITTVEQGYDAQAEVTKLLWADVIIYQTPVYWFSIPWLFKKYIDEVFTAGYGRLFDSDGRSRKDASRKYGTTGLMQGRKYMLSTTWNAPLEAFTDPAQIFEGRDADEVFFYFRKSQQYLGLESLPGFACYDVVKNPAIEHDFERFAAHLDRYF